MTPTKRTRSKPAPTVRERALQVSETPTAHPESGERWHEQAAFHLTLQHALDAGDTTIWRTRVYHEESGEERTEPGILQPEALAWIRERAGAPGAAQELEVAGQPPMEGALDTPAEAPRAEPRLSVQELAIEQVEAEQEIGGAAPRPLRAYVHFTLSNLPEANLGPQTAHYAIQVLAYPHDASQAIVLASGRRELAADEPSSTTMLDFDVPPVGEYQTIASVVLEDQDLAGVALGPLLTVAP